MTSVMVSTFTLSTFHSCQVMHHMTLHVVSTFHSLSDMQDTHNQLLVDRVLSQDYKVSRMRSSFHKFYSRHPHLIAKYQRSVRNMLNDSFPTQFIYTAEILSVFIIYRICNLECHFNNIVAVFDGCHA